MEKKLWLFVFAFLISIYTVSAAYFYGYGGIDIITLYREYYQVVDLVLYFLFFSAIAKLTIGAKFKDVEKGSSNMLTFVFGIVLAILLVFVETQYYGGPIIFQQLAAFLIFILLILWIFAAWAIKGLGLNGFLSAVIAAILCLGAWFSLRDRIYYDGFGMFTYGIGRGSWFMSNWAILILLALAIVGFVRQNKSPGSP